MGGFGSGNGMDLTITLQPDVAQKLLFGAGDRNLRMVREHFSIRVVARNGAVKLSGSSQSVGRAASVIEKMQKTLLEGGSLDSKDVQEALSSVEMDSESEPGGGVSRIDVFNRGMNISPKTEGQEKYVDAVNANDLVFCLGPAGTGKTYLAVAMAVSFMKRGVVKRIVLVRPAVEAGEKLGYLPGDLQAKVNPYLRPLFDAMHDMMSFDQLKRFMFNDLIEVVPLAYMRGRTLNNSVVILDEAQNTTSGQMLMFLTRMGHHSKMIVTGDDTQTDLDKPEKSGLIDAVNRLHPVDGVGIVKLTRSDIVRHRLVEKIVQAYGKNVRI